MSEPNVDPATIGPFEVKRKLGEGAMGVVYEGYDAKLDRKVALKLVRRQLLNNPAVRDRMTREAQAMARLSNPNVVQVYQVGEHDGGIYVAMEYVEGETLTDWLKREAHPWRVVLRTICDAGRGLAAAHAAGLVHRDFKPDNVLVDAAGRARVLDFGLVHAAGSTDDLAHGGTDEGDFGVTETGDGALQTTHPMALTSSQVDRSNLLHWSVRLTQLGNAIGTPAYMSPEQHFGRPAGPKSDQFSFGITLYEALYGARPFGGDSWAAIRLQIQEGVVPPPPLESTVPRRIFKILARSLAIDPEGRWPSMTALIEALEHDPWRVPVRVAAMLALITIASVASYAIAMTRVEAARRCQLDPAALAGVWDAARESAVARAFDATHLPFAAETAKRVQARLGAYAQAWLGEHQAACEAHAAGVQSSRQLDLRMACLDRRKQRLGALVGVLAAADRAAVENAVQAVDALPSLAACSDAESLQADAPPEDPEIAARVAALRVLLSKADADESTGHYAEGLPIAEQVRAEAGLLKYAPLEAEAALSEGRLLMSTAGGARAEAALAHAIRLGITHDLYGVAAEAATIRIFILTAHLGRSAEAMATAPFAEALVERARTDDRLAALLHSNLGVTYMFLGADFEVAESEFQRALAAVRRRDKADPLEAIVHNNLGSLNGKHGRHERGRWHYAQAEELFAAALGEEHPLTAVAAYNKANADLALGEHLKALPNYLRAIAVIESSQGREHRYLIEPLLGLGKVHAHLGRSLEAGEHFARAVQIGEKLGIRDEAVADALEGLADLAAAAGSVAQARGLYERAAEMFDIAVGSDGDKGARAAMRAGELASEAGEREAAIGWFERVLAKKTGNAETEAIRAQASLRLAAVLTQRGDPTERVCALFEAGRARTGPEDPARAATEQLFARACGAR